MLLIGENPEDITLDVYGGGSFTLSSATFSNKVTLISFIDINNGWDWLQHLVDLRSTLSTTDYNIIAVIYDLSSSVDSFTINLKFPDPNLVQTDLQNSDLPVLMDTSWATSAALDYQGGFAPSNDIDFNGNAGTSNWNYIISKDYLITDKWNLNGTINVDPISFNRLTIPAVPAFDTTDFTNTKEYIVERMTNLNADPKILSANPAENSYWGAAPANVEVVFSKPIDETEAETTTNYTLSGSGISAGSVSGADYSGVNKIENVVELSFTGLTLNDSVGVEDAANITVNNITDTQGTALTGDNELNYLVETSPRILSIVKNPHVG